MTFAHPAILLLLWLTPLPLVFVFYLRRRRLSRAARISSVAAKRTSAFFAAQGILLTVALVLCVVATARPRWGQRETTVVGAGRNVAILLDVSRSMLARDVRPDRLGRAKADLTDLIAALDGDRAALIAFRKGARVICPFTTDMAFLAQALDGVSIDSAPRGETDIGGAIAATLDAFKNLGADHNVIVLISDGEDLAGAALEQAKIAADMRIPIFCVGIGDTEGSVIPDGDGNGGATVRFRGEELRTRLENETLDKIASVSGGAYIPLQTAATGRRTLGEIYNDYVRSVIAGEMLETSETIAVERFQIFLIPALAFALIAGSLSTGRPTKHGKNNH